MEIKKLPKLNIDDITFVREKTNNKKKIHYSILINEKQKISFTISNVNVPFGFEEFGKKRILNIEISKDKHSDVDKLISYLEDNIEKVISNKTISTEFIEDVAGKKYYKNIKSSKYGKIIRTYVLHDPEIYAMIGCNKMPMSSIDLKKTICNINMEINGIWINNTDYGLLLYVREIQILSSY
jgi:rRNA maturation protein Rpf1